MGVADFDIAHNLYSTAARFAKRRAGFVHQGASDPMPPLALVH